VLILGDNASKDENRGVPLARACEKTGNCEPVEAEHGKSVGNTPAWYEQPRQTAHQIADHGVAKPHSNRLGTEEEKEPKTSSHPTQTPTKHLAVFGHHPFTDKNNSKKSELLTQVIRGFQP
jgi:hypothetical protein